MKEKGGSVSEWGQRGEKRMVERKEGERRRGEGEEEEDDGVGMLTKMAIRPWQ
jgi:hypothetical protein